VRGIASHGGDVSHYAPPVVCAALAQKFGPPTAPPVSLPDPK
jgi:pantetheine-phosphate adenylyltransferase